MSVALPYSPADDEQGAGAPSALVGLLTHLDTVYGFALTLTGDPEAAAELTEDVYASARDGLWATLGGHGLRDRLLARCVWVFVGRGAPRGTAASSAGATAQGRPTRLDALLRALPWDERAAIALVDQLRSSYAAAAAVLDVDVAELRELLHRGRSPPALAGATRSTGDILMHTLSRTVFLLAILGACSRDATSPDGPLPRSAALARGGSDVGAVFTLSNSAAGNAVIAFGRSADGTLTPAGTFATQGNGTGAGLGSQGAVGLSGDGQFLFAVNAASNSITSFAVDGTSLTRVSTVASGGTLPISLTTHGNLVYVLNAGGTENITGFSVDANGSLTALPGSSRPLSGTGVGPAEVGFDPSGSWLVVTEKNTNRIDVFAVGSGGYASAPVVNPSAGQTPFGFAFNQHGVLIVSEAFGGGVDASAVSSYTLGTNGTLAVVSASVPTTETAACWVAVTNNGKFAYAANTGSASVTGYRVDKANLSILDAGGKTGDTGNTPIDAAVSRNSQFLYTLTAGSHEITAFSVRQNDGSLTPVGGASGLPVGTVGLAAK